MGVRGHTSRSEVAAKRRPEPVLWRLVCGDVTCAGRLQLLQLGVECESRSTAPGVSTSSVCSPGLGTGCVGDYLKIINCL